MIKDANGKVYLRYHQPVPKLVNIGGVEHVCDVRHGVSMLLLEESQVQSALETKGGCCGGQKLIFSLPSQEAINVYLTGHRD